MKFTAPLWKGILAWELPAMSSVLLIISQTLVVSAPWTQGALKVVSWWWSWDGGFLCEHRQLWSYRGAGQSQREAGKLCSSMVPHFSLFSATWFKFSALVMFSLPFLDMFALCIILLSNIYLMFCSHWALVILFFSFVFVFLLQIKC